MAPRDEFAQRLVRHDKGLPLSLGCAIPRALPAALKIPDAGLDQGDLPPRVQGLTRGMLGLVDALLVLAKFGKGVAMLDGIEPVDMFFEFGHP